MEMRRVWRTMLTAALLLSLAACSGGGGGASSSLGSASMPEEPSVSTLAPGSQSEPEPVLPYTNPLTGEGSQEDLGKNRPVAIMINNLKKALPQLGVSQADVIYEIVAEGGITRMMALYQDVEGAGLIGSVRSARDYYVSLAYGHDAIFLHAGGSDQAYIAIRNWGVTALDCVNGPYEGTLFWRDPDRRKNMGLEHSVLTSDEKIQELLPTYKKVEPEHREDFQVGWTFSQEAPAGGEGAVRLTVPFSRYKTGVFVYDQEKNQYLVEEYDKPYVDGNTGEQVAVSNVLVLYTDVSAIQGDSAGRQSVRTTGSGTGVLARDGQLYPITWQREDKSDCLTFLDQAGAPMPLAVGHSYINIVDESAGVTWE